MDAVLLTKLRTLAERTLGDCAFTKRASYLGREADTVVPFAMSREIAEGNSHCALEAVPDAGHAQSYLVDLAHYETATRKFISDCLQSKKEHT